ncbi:hypothetical protein HRbin24_00114 [bacterium HR24]|nr:hypothetical protein HRbin24_00114 [bacterium HR24]
MGRMVRKQLYIEKRQDEALRERARRLGVSEAALIRSAIDMAMGAAFWPWQDEEAWRQARVYMQKRQNMAAPQATRAWTREELYAQ